jgi:DNA-directed RNA polymerase specialized sigma subunit
MSQPADPNQSHRPYPRVVAYPAKPRPHRPVNPHASANELAMRYCDIATKVATHYSKRTGHPAEDLWQIAMMGIIQASRRFEAAQGEFRNYACKSAYGAVRHYLRDKGFILKVSPSWRELFARGKKLLRLGTPPNEVASRLKLTPQRWEEIVTACSQRVVSWTEIEAQ